MQPYVNERCGPLVRMIPSEMEGQLEVGLMMDTIRWMR